MRLSLLIHVSAGGVALVAGTLAVVAAKGSVLHRRSGQVFAWSMGVMGLTGTAIAMVEWGEAAIIGGLLAAYLVFTGATTSRPSSPVARALFPFGAVAAVALGLASAGVGGQMILAGERSREGVPAAMFFVHGSVALIGGIGDLRLLGGRILDRASRLRRHLWRMCFALFLATGSFFLGQAKVLPEVLRVPLLLAVLAFAPLVVMAFWLHRVGRKKSASVAAGALAERSL